MPKCAGRDIILVSLYGMVKVKHKEYLKYLKNLAREQEPGRLPKDVDKLIKRVKHLEGMVNALMLELGKLKFGVK